MQPCPFIYGFSTAVFVVHFQSWVVATGMYGPQSLKYLYLILYRKTSPTPVLGRWGWENEMEDGIQFLTFPFCSSRSCSSRVYPRGALWGEDLYPVETSQWDQRGHHALWGKAAPFAITLLWFYSIDFFSLKVVNAYDVQSSIEGMKASEIQLPKGFWQYSGKETQGHTVALS